MEFPPPLIHELHKFAGPLEFKPDFSAESAKIISDCHKSVEKLFATHVKKIAKATFKKNIGIIRDQLVSTVEGSTIDKARHAKAEIPFPSELKKFKVANEKIAMKAFEDHLKHYLRREWKGFRYFITTHRGRTISILADVN